MARRRIFKKRFQCSNCKTWFGTKGGIARHNQPFPAAYENKQKRQRCVEK